jgi:hypothetical protein
VHDRNSAVIKAVDAQGEEFTGNPPKSIKRLIKFRQDGFRETVDGNGKQMKAVFAWKELPPPRTGCSLQGVKPINSLFLTVQRYGNKVKNSGKEGIFKSVKQRFEDSQNGRCNQNGKRGIESPVRPGGTYGTENPAAVECRRETDREGGIRPAPAGKTKEN